MCIRDSMKPVKLFYQERCPFCKKALRYIEELKEEHLSLIHICKGNNGEQSLGFSPNASFKLGVYFGCRLIFLGYSFDVKEIFGWHKNKAKKTEMALKLYSSKFGVDLYYRKTGSDFKIRSSSGFDLNLSLIHIFKATIIKFRSTSKVVVSRGW